MANILVVDDEENVRSLIKEVLVMNSHTCGMAASGPEALELIRKTRYDLVILDRFMPGMTGIEALMILRSNAAYKNLKVIICTAADMMGEVEEAFAAGANDYILKPLNFKQLAEKVSAALQK